MQDDVRAAVALLEQEGLLRPDEARRIVAEATASPTPDASPAIASGRVVLGPLAVVLAAAVLIPAIDGASDPVSAVGLAAAVLVAGGGLLLAALAWRTGTVVREGLLLAGATAWALVGMFLPTDMFWATLPGVLLAWGALGLFLGPWARGAFAVLAWPATAGALVAAGLDGSTAGVVTVALLGVYLALVWAAEPLGSPLRRFVPMLLMGGSGLVLLLIAAFLVSGITVGRVAAFALVTAVFLASSALVLDERLRSFTLAKNWRRVGRPQ